MDSDSTETIPATAEQRKALAVAITSGKGGVGKTNLTTNLGIALAKQGHKVCIFDADTSLANINILLGLTPDHTLEQFLNEEMAIEDILLEGPEGLKIVPSASGIAEFSHLNELQQQRIIDALQTLESKFDYILIDTAAGISETVISFLQSAQYAVVVVSPEPTSLTDAFSLIKVLQRRNYQQPIYTLVNMANNYKHSMDVFKRFAHAINKYVHLKVRYLGYIPMDRAMRSAVASQSPVILSEPQSPAARCITLLTQILVKHFTEDETPQGSISQFWRTRSQSSEKAGDELGTKDAEVEATVELKTSSVISNQQEKEASRILALTKDALSSQEFTQPQTEELLASLIESYLVQFGTLPQQAIDLVLQAQDQLPPELGTQLATQAPANDESGTSEEVAEEPPEFELEPSAQDEAKEKPQLLTIQDQIGSLVNDAERTKRQLTDLADFLKSQYRSLYNTDIAFASVPRKQSRPAQDDNGTIAALEHAGLVQSIHYAAATDSDND